MSDESIGSTSTDVLNKFEDLKPTPRAGAAFMITCKMSEMGDWPKHWLGGTNGQNIWVSGRKPGCRIASDLVDKMDKHEVFAMLCIVVEAVRMMDTVTEPRK